MTVGSELLKQSLHRSVRLEQRGESTVVVKRFEQRGPLGRALDRRRARREHEMLAHLFAAGVDVPRPLACTRRERAYEVELDYVAGARPLSALLDGQALRDGSARLSVELARRLGRLLADLHSHGVDHPDLHAGNVLVAPDGRVLAVDFDKASLVKRVGDAHVLRDLVSLCAGLRETTTAAWRAAALDAWWSALEPTLHAELRRPAGEALETLARARRRRVVQERERRWTRAGSAVQPLADGRGFARVGADAARVALALRGEQVPGCVRVGGTKRRVLQAWRALARLEEHGFGAPRCFVLRLDVPCAWLEVEAVRERSTPRERGWFLASLLDRGLWCDELSPAAQDDAGGFLPLSLSHVAAGLERERLAPWLAPLSALDRREFLRGAGAAWRGPAREREAWLAPLRDA